MKKPYGLHFVPAGYPISCPKKNNIECIKYTINELKLDGIELEFTYGIKVANKEKLSEFLKNNVKNFIVTSHAPYYINLNAEEESKFKNSINMIYESAKITYELDGYSVAIHAAWYQKKDKNYVYNRVKEGFKEVINKLKDEGIEIWIRPETMDLDSKFGEIDEVIKLSQELEMVLPCIDFAHLRFRHNRNDIEFFREILEKIEKELGKEALNNMHMHMEGIGSKDESGKGSYKDIAHKNLKESDMPWQDILKLLKEFKVKGVIVSESPNIEEDAILMKEYYKSIGGEVLNPEIIEEDKEEKEGDKESKSKRKGNGRRKRSNKKN